MSHLTISETKPNIYIVSLNDIKDMQTADAIGDELAIFANEGPRTRNAKRTVILDFGNTESLSSAMPGKLSIFHRKLSALGDSLILADIKKDIFDVFKIVNLDKKFTCRPDSKAEDVAATAAISQRL